MSLKFLFLGWMYQCICDQVTRGPGHLANPPVLDLEIIWETLVCILNFQVKAYQCFNPHPNLSVSLSWKRLHEGPEESPSASSLPPSLTLVFSLPSCGFFFIIIIIIFIFMGQPTSTCGTLYWWPGSVLSMSPYNLIQSLPQTCEVLLTTI